MQVTLQTGAKRSGASGGLARAPKAIQGRIHLSTKTDSIEGRPQALACCLLLCSGTFPITPKGVFKQFRNVIGHGGLEGATHRSEGMYTGPYF